MRPVTADAALKMPVFRHLLGWVGAVGASKQSMLRTLRNGDSLCLIPGGIAEMFLSRPGQKNTHSALVLRRFHRIHHTGQDTVLLNNRKGFVRLALEAGVDLVPTYCFGASLVDFLP